MTNNPAQDKPSGDGTRERITAPFNAGWGYGCSSMMPFLRQQREARSGELLETGPRKHPRD